MNLLVHNVIEREKVQMKTLLDVPCGPDNQKKKDLI